MSADTAAQREIMVDSQVRTQDVTDLAIIEAMRAFPRESLLPADRAYAAYAETEVQYAPGRWLLTPRDAAKLLQGVAPRAGERALAIAAPYLAGVMALMGLAVTRLDGPDLTAVDGRWDVLVSEGAVAQAPAAWLAALAPEGRAGIVVRDGPVGRAMLYLATPAGPAGRPMFDCTPPQMAGFEPVRSFAF